MNEIVNVDANDEHGQDENMQNLDFSFVIASSVHDMKNSLGMLLSSLEELIGESTSESDAQKKRIAILQYEATRINTELVQLLSLYRFQHQSQAVSIEENFIFDTVEDQIARNDMLFKTQNIEVEIDCDPDLVWYYDNDLIGSVIHNVLVNGTRYASKKMHLTAKVIDDFLVLEIADDGDGFPANMIDAASLESDAHRDGNSTQLGLFFAAKIAGFHQQDERKGSIELFNGGPLEGGVFRISIP
ncbi:MAG: K+-sensing histidine kinase KdpD [Kiritimatiellia bacterium]|jgi:K+-sensing histidine kinase KdpD